MDQFEKAVYDFVTDNKRNSFLEEARKINDADCTLNTVRPNNPDYIIINVSTPSWKADYWVFNNGDVCMFDKVEI